MKKHWGHAVDDELLERSYRAPTLPTMPKDFVDTNLQRADVPCGKCQLCCKTLIVPLAQEEYEKYDWAWVVNAKTGERLGRALKRQSNGDCVYLGEQGCTIHGRAPHVCQRFDCRELFLKSDRAGRRQAIKSGKLPKALFDRGRELLEKENDRETT
jgi:Fe-S-cluster containining protein